MARALGKRDIMLEASATGVQYRTSSGIDIPSSALGRSRTTAPISLNSGSNQALEGALIWRIKGLHCFYTGSPPEDHNASVQEKGGSLFWTPTAATLSW